MKYTSVNELSNFDYHDAELNSIIFQDCCLRWEVSNINATTANSQNDFGVDMCIGNATMVFNDVTIEGIVFGAYTSTQNGIITEYPSVAVKSEEHLDALKSIIDEDSYIYDLEELVAIDANRYKARFHIGFNTYLSFIFTESIISWKEFIGKAWYEHDKWKKQ